MWAECNSCRLVFETKGLIKISGSAKLTVKGNSTYCPRCGAKARIIDAEYNYNDGKISSVSGLTDRDAQLLLKVLQDAWANPPRSQKDRDLLASQIKQAAPSAAWIADDIQKGAPILSIILIVINLLWTIYSDAQQSDLNEDLLSTTHQLLETAERNGTSLQELVDAVEVQNKDLAEWARQLVEQAAEKPGNTELEECDESSLSSHNSSRRNLRSDESGDSIDKRKPQSDD